MSVEVLRDNFASVIAALAEASAEAPIELAQATAELAQTLAPVKTGELRDSIHAEGNETVADADYAGAVEFGTHATPPRPFMTPASELIAAKAAEIAGNVLKEKL